MRNRCIKCRFICHLTQTEPIFCKRPSLHSEKPTRQPHLKLLLSYVKGTQATLILLQPRTCQSIIRQMAAGELIPSVRRTIVSLCLMHYGCCVRFQYLCGAME